MVGASVVLDAPCDDVWSFITDPDNFSAYVDGYVQGRVTSAKRTGIGAHYEWTGRVGPLRFSSTERVVEWQDGHRVAYRGMSAGVGFGSAMTVEPDNSGRSSLRVEIDYRLPRRLGGRLIDALIVRRLVRTHVERSLRQLTAVFG